MRSAQRNPVAAAVGFCDLIGDIVSALVGCTDFSYLTSDRGCDRKTTYFGERPKGAFGRCRACFGVVEAQGRGSLHFHALLWGGLTARMLEGGAHHSTARSVLADAMDKMYVAELPRWMHVRDLVRSEARLEGLADESGCVWPALGVARSPLYDAAGFRGDVEECICCNGIHRHRDTCHKGRHGEDGCRFDAPWEQQCGTKPFQLVTGNDASVTPVSDVEAPCAGSELYWPLAPPERRLIRWELKRRLQRDLPPTLDFKANPHLCVQELMESSGMSLTFTQLAQLRALSPDRLLALYDRVRTRLPTRNEWVVPYNPVLTAAIRCHSAVVPLGGSTESRLASLYLVPYLNKNKRQLVHVLSVAHQSFSDVIRYPSLFHRADETAEESISRTVQHFLTRLLNKLNVIMEVSDVQAASALLGFKVAVTSESFVPFRGDAAIRFVDFLGSGERMDDLPSHADLAEGMDVDPLPFVSVDQFGPGDIVTGRDGRSVLVTQSWQYQYRGFALADLSRIEYASLIDVRRKSKKRCHEGAGRPYTRRFEFDRDCPLFESHEQIIRSKQRTPIMYGRAPMLPGPRPSAADKDADSWIIRADSFARYYLVCFRPGSRTSVSLCYDWQAFLSYIADLRRGSDALGRFRYASIMRTIYRDSCTSVMRDALSNYRARHRTKWRSTRGAARDDGASFSEMLKGYLLRWEEENLTSAQIRNAWKMCDYVHHQSHQIDDVSRLSCQNSAGSRTTASLVTTLPDGAAEALTEQLTSGAHRVRGLPLTMTNQRVNNGSFGEFIRDFILEGGREPPRDQLAVLRFLHSRFVGNTGGGATAHPTCLLVTGGPGTGKSYLVQLIKRMCNICGFGALVSTAYSGVAASHIGGQTLCSLFQIPFAEKADDGEEDCRACKIRIRPLSSARLQEFRDSICVDSMCCLLVDEMSMLTPQLISVIDSRLRQATSLDAPFGGVSILLVSACSVSLLSYLRLIRCIYLLIRDVVFFKFGDLRQLPPVKAISICQGAVEMAVYDATTEGNNSQFTRRTWAVLRNRYSPVSSMRRGLALIKAFVWMPLTTQHRSTDLDHTEFVMRMWRGEAIRVRDLMRYKVLQPADLDRNLDWLSAPVLVSTNQERLALVHSRAVSFARLRGTCVLRWRLDMKQWRGRPLDSDGPARSTIRAFSSILLLGRLGS